MDDNIMNSYRKVALTRAGGTYDGLNNNQKEEVKLGFQHGLNPELVAVYAKHRYSDRQMSFIRQMLEKNYRRDVIKLFTTRSFDAVMACQRDSMSRFVDAFAGKVDDNELSVYNSYDYSIEQLTEIRLSFKDDLPDKAIGMISDNAYDYWHMHQLRLAWKADLSGNDIKLLSNKKLIGGQAEWILKGLLEFQREIVDIYASPVFNYEQMRELYKALHYGVSPEKVKTYCADPKMGWGAISNVTLMLLERNPYEDSIVELEKHGVYYNDFSFDQRHEIRKGFEAGLAVEEVLQYCDLSLSAEEHDDERCEDGEGYEPCWGSDSEDNDKEYDPYYDFYDDSEMGVIRRRLIASHKS